MMGEQVKWCPCGCGDRYAVNPEPARDAGEPMSDEFWRPEGPSAIVFATPIDTNGTECSMCGHPYGATVDWCPRCFPAASQENP